MPATHHHQQQQQQQQQQQHPPSSARAPPAATARMPAAAGTKPATTTAAKPLAGASRGQQGKQTASSLAASLVSSFSRARGTSSSTSSNHGSSRTSAEAPSASGAGGSQPAATTTTSSSSSSSVAVPRAAPPPGSLKPLVRAERSSGASDGSATSSGVSPRAGSLTEPGSSSSPAVGHAAAYSLEGGESVLFQCAKVSFLEDDTAAVQPPGPSGAGAAASAAAACQRTGRLHPEGSALSDDSLDCPSRCPLKRAHTAGLGQLQLFAPYDTGPRAQPVSLGAAGAPEEATPASPGGSRGSVFTAFLKKLLPVDRISRSTHSSPTSSTRSSLDVPRQVAAAGQLSCAPDGALGSSVPPALGSDGGTLAGAVAYKQHHGYLPSPSVSCGGGLLHSQSGKSCVGSALSHASSRSSPEQWQLLPVDARAPAPSGLSTPGSSSSRQGSPPASLEGGRNSSTSANPPLPPGAVPLFGGRPADGGAASPPAATAGAAAAVVGSPPSASGGSKLMHLRSSCKALDPAMLKLLQLPPASQEGSSAGGGGSSSLSHSPQQQRLIKLGPAALPGPLLLAVSPRLPPSMRREQWSLADFAVQRQLYAGYASTICKARDRVSGRVVALKLYRVHKLNEVSSHQVAREVRLHIGLDHEHIIALHAAFQEAGSVVLVQEFAGGGDLWAFIDANSGRLTERATVSLVLQPFLRGLMYLHSLGIAHRDIKPENVLFGGGGMVLKLADFGLALNLREERAVTRVGTLDYMPPEVLRCPLKRRPGDNKDRTDLQYASAVDAWAVGVLAYELLTGRAPFSAASASDASIEAAIASGVRTVDFPSRMSDAARSFITAALHQAPGARPTIVQMLQHPWIRSFQRSSSNSRAEQGSGDVAGSRSLVSTLSPAPPAPASPAQQQHQHEQPVSRSVTLPPVAAARG